MQAALLPEVATAPAARILDSAPFLIANAGCERFRFYGLGNVPTRDLGATRLAYLPEAERKIAAAEVFHAFAIDVHFLPRLGGWRAERYVGKARAIRWLRRIYWVGQRFLSAFPRGRGGFYAVAAVRPGRGPARRAHRAAHRRCGAAAAPGSRPLLARDRM